MAGDREGAGAAISDEIIDGRRSAAAPPTSTTASPSSSAPAPTRCSRCPSATARGSWRRWPRPPAAPRREQLAERAAGRHRGQRAEGPVPGRRVRGRAARPAARARPRAGVRRGVEPRRPRQGRLLRAARRERGAALLDVAQRLRPRCGSSSQNGMQVVLAGGCDYYPGQLDLLPLVHLPRHGRCAWPARASCSPRSSGCGASSTPRACSSRRSRCRRPALPRSIGVVTGEGGKARDDVLAGLRRRGWEGRLVWGFAPVQDRRAAPLIARALQDLAAVGGVEAIVVARGGGSVMDLMAFSDETLCRTVALLPVPVIASVGHHTDRTLIDDVAAVSCSTPTHAAETAVAIHCGEARDARCRRRRAASTPAGGAAWSSAPGAWRQLTRAPAEQLGAPARLAAPEDSRAARGRARAAASSRPRELHAPPRRCGVLGPARPEAAARRRRRCARRAATSSGSRWRWPHTTPSARSSAATRWSRTRTASWSPRARGRARRRRRLGPLPRRPRPREDRGR